MADSTIAPGDSTWIEIVLGTGRMLGAIEKYAKISSDAIGRIPALIIKANIRKEKEDPPPLSADPPGVFLDSINQPEIINGFWEIPVTLKNNSKDAVTVTVVDSPLAFVQLREQTIALRPNGEQSIIFRIDPALIDEPYGKSVTFEMDNTAHTRLTVPVGRRPDY